MKAAAPFSIDDVVIGRSPRLRAVPLPTPRLFHVVLSYDVIVRADDLAEAERVAELHGPTNAVWSSEGGELRMLPDDVEIDEAVITSDGDHVTIEQCIAAGQAPY